MQAEDREVLAMVNGAAEARKAQRCLDAYQARKAAKYKRKARKELGATVLEAGSCVGLAVAVLAVMAQGLMAPEIAVPVAGASLICGAVRADRYFRR